MVDSLQHDEASLKPAMKVLLRKRGNVKHKLTCFFKYIQPIGEAFDTGLNIGESTLSELSIKVKLLETNFNEFLELQSEIEVSCEEIELEKYYDEREDIASKYTEALALAQLILKKFNISSDSVSDLEGSTRKYLRKYFT